VAEPPFGVKGQAKTILARQTIEAKWLASWGRGRDVDKTLPGHGL